MKLAKDFRFYKFLTIGERSSSFPNDCLIYYRANTRSILGASVYVRGDCVDDTILVKNTYYETSGLDIYETNRKSREQTDSATRSPTSNTTIYVRSWRST